MTYWSDHLSIFESVCIAIPELVVTFPRPKCFPILDIAFEIVFYIFIELFGFASQGSRLKSTKAMHGGDFTEFGRILLYSENKKKKKKREESVYHEQQTRSRGKCFMLCSSRLSRKSGMMLSHPTVCVCLPICGEIVISLRQGNQSPKFGRV